MREAFKRTIGVRLFDVQLMGGIVLHEGDIAEMKTGEGKTFVATQALYLNALNGRGTHLVTVNDYLAKRDMEWTRPVFDLLGMRTGSIENMMPFGPRKESYEADVTYGTNSEFGFDYLRDNMSVSLEGLVQRGHPYAIVDEVDSILIDEARTPLIISGEPETAAQIYYDFARVAPTLDRAPGPSGRPEGRGRGRRRRLRVRREAQDGRRHRAGRREGRARAAARQPLRAAELAARQPSRAGVEGAGALQPRRRIRDPGRRGEDRRRVHGPHHGGAPLERRPPPGGRGEGGRAHPGGAPDARHDHAAELLPPLRQAGRHDRHGEDGGEGVRRDLQPPRRSRSRRTSTSRASTSRISSSRRRKASSPQSRATSRSATTPGSPCSSARSPSRRRSTSRSC